MPENTVVHINISATDLQTEVKDRILAMLDMCKNEFKQLDNDLAQILENNFWRYYEPYDSGNSD